MTARNIEVSEAWGCLVAIADYEQEKDMEHRWWFSETDAGRLVFVSEVVEYSSVGVRDYVPEDEAEVPDDIAEAVTDEGYDTIVDTDGFILHSEL